MRFIKIVVLVFCGFALQACGKGEFSKSPVAKSASEDATLYGNSYEGMDGDDVGVNDDSGSGSDSSGSTVIPKSCPKIADTITACYFSEEGISASDSLMNCLVNATNNPNAAIICYYDGKVLYQRAANSVSSDKSPTTPPPPAKSYTVDTAICVVKFTNYPETQGLAVTDNKSQSACLTHGLNNFNANKGKETIYVYHFKISELGVYKNGDLTKVTSSLMTQIAVHAQRKLVPDKKHVGSGSGGNGIVMTGS